MRCASCLLLRLPLAGNASFLLPSHTVNRDGFATLLPQVGRMCQAQRRQLLVFVTSSSALPAGGFAALRGFNGALHPFTGVWAAGTNCETVSLLCSLLIGGLLRNCVGCGIA